MKLKINCFLLIVILSISNSYGQIRSISGKIINKESMNRFLQRQVDSLNMPGLSIAFINNGKIVYSNEYGYADIENKIKVKSNTIFEAASLSKTAFAYFILKLADKGILNLDTPLYTYLRNKDLEYDERYKLITARMVLSHTTGMPNWRQGNLELKFTPGTEFSYSGEAYQYLVAVVGHLMNKTPKELDQEFYNQVGKPLKMKHAYYYWNDYISEHRAAGYKEDKGVNKKQEINKMEDFGAAGSLRTNAIDYANFMIGIMNGKGLSKNMIKEMFKEQTKVPDWKSTDAWGLGISMKKTKYGMRYMHSGDNGDFTAYFIMNREKKAGFIFLTNCEKARALFQKLEPYFIEGSIN